MIAELFAVAWILRVCVVGNDCVDVPMARHECQQLVAATPERPGRTAECLVGEGRGNRRVGALTPGWARVQFSGVLLERAAMGKIR